MGFLNSGVQPSPSSWRSAGKSGVSRGILGCGTRGGGHNFLCKAGSQIYRYTQNIFPCRPEFVTANCACQSPSAKTSCLSRPCHGPSWPRVSLPTYAGFLLRVRKYHGCERRLGGFRAHDSRLQPPGVQCYRRCRNGINKTTYGQFLRAIGGVTGAPQQAIGGVTEALWASFGGDRSDRWRH